MYSRDPSQSLFLSEAEGLKMTETCASANTKLNPQVGKSPFTMGVKAGLRGKVPCINKRLL